MTGQKIIQIVQIDVVSYPSAPIGHAGGGFYDAPMILDSSLLAAQATDGVMSILLWSAALIVAVLAMFVLIMYLRKLMVDQGPPPVDPPFTLDDLRRMHGRGELSDEQYQAARQRIIAVAGGVGGVAVPGDPALGAAAAVQPPVPDAPAGSDDAESDNLTEDGGQTGDAGTNRP